MPTITLSARAAVYRGNPFDRIEETDPGTLREFHALDSDDEQCSDYFEEDFVNELGLAGGRIRFYYDEQLQQLRVSSTFGIKSKPSKSQLDRLRTETDAQWSDGIGNGVFSFLDRELLSSSLVMALLHEQPELESELASHTIDAFPAVDRNPKAAWSENDNPNCFQMQDLTTEVEAGNAAAKAQLGYIFLNGQLAKQDIKRGLQLLTESAKANNETGLIHLANAYLDGEQIKANPPLAEKLLNKAIAGGSLLAKAILGEAYKEGKGVAKQPARAIQLLTQASEAGLPIAMAELGDCYEFGIGVDTNLATAKHWYSTALEQGFEPVAPAFERVRKQLQDAGIFGRIKSLFGSLFNRSRKLSVTDTAIVGVESSDPEMEAAVAKAQASLHKFAEALKKLKPGDNSAIKVRFEEQGQAEFMWLSNVQFVDGHFWGVLDNDPQIVSNLTVGEKHKAHPNDVNDWLISDSKGKVQGGFTISVLQKRMG